MRQRHHELLVAEITFCSCFLISKAAVILVLHNACQTLTLQIKLKFAYCRIDSLLRWNCRFHSEVPNRSDSKIAQLSITYTFGSMSREKNLAQCDEHQHK